MYLKNQSETKRLLSEKYIFVLSFNKIAIFFIDKSLEFFGFVSIFAVLNITYEADGSLLIACRLFLCPVIGIAI